MNIVPKVSQWILYNTNQTLLRPVLKKPNLKLVDKKIYSTQERKETRCSQTVVRRWPVYYFWAIQGVGRYTSGKCQQSQWRIYLIHMPSIRYCLQVGEGVIISHHVTVSPTHFCGISWAKKVIEIRLTVVSTSQPLIQWIKPYVTHS